MSKTFILETRRNVGPREVEWIRRVYTNHWPRWYFRLLLRSRGWRVRPLITFCVDDQASAAIARAYAGEEDVDD